MITAVVITARGGHFLDKCLNSLFTQIHPPQKIIVVHSFPCTTYQKNLQYIHTYGYHGYAHAVNCGVYATDTPFFVVLNDDTCLDSSFLEQLAIHATDKTILQPQIRQMDCPNLIENAGHWISKDGHNIARGRGSSCETKLSTELLAFSGAAFFAPRSLIETIGPMDEELFSFGEDLDWSLRALRHAYQIQYIEKAIVHHKLGGSHSRAGFQKGRRVERNRICAVLRSWPQKMILQSPWHTSKRLSIMGMGALFGRGSAAPSPFSTALGASFGFLESLSMIRSARNKRKSDQVNWILDDPSFLDMIERNIPPLGAIWHPLFS